MIRKIYTAQPQDYQVDLATRIVRHCITREKVDSDGDVILVEGIDTSPLMQSGSVLTDHVPFVNKVFGQCMSISMESGEGQPPALIVESKAADRPPAELHPADAPWEPNVTLWMLYKGDVRGSSVGLSLVAARAATDADKRTYGATCKRVITKSKLLEYSITPMPSNTGATTLVKSLRAGLDATTPDNNSQPVDKNVAGRACDNLDTVRHDVVRYCESHTTDCGQEPDMTLIKLRNPDADAGSNGQNVAVVDNDEGAAGWTKESALDELRTLAKSAKSADEFYFSAGLAVGTYTDAQGEPIAFTADEIKSCYKPAAQPGLPRRTVTNPFTGKSVGVPAAYSAPQTYGQYQNINVVDERQLPARETKYFQNRHQEQVTGEFTRALALMTLGKSRFDTGMIKQAEGLIRQNINKGYYGTSEDVQNLLTKAGTTTDVTQLAGVLPQASVDAIIIYTQKYGTFYSSVRDVSSLIVAGNLNMFVESSQPLAYWITEGLASPNTEITGRNVTGACGKMATAYPYNIELDVRSTNVDLYNFWTMTMFNAMQKQLDAAGWMGTGTSTYGLVNGLVPLLNSGPQAAANRTYYAFTASSGGASSWSSITLPNLIGLTATIQMKYWALGGQPEWRCHLNFYRQVMYPTLFAIANGAAGGGVRPEDLTSYDVQSMQAIAQGELLNNRPNQGQATFLGYKVNFDATFPAAGVTSTGNQASVIFGYPMLSSVCGFDRNLGMRMKIDPWTGVAAEQVYIRMFSNPLLLNWCIVDPEDATLSGPVVAGRDAHS